MPVLLAAALALLAALPARSADLPVTRIVLYKNGIAYFERRGTLPAGAEAHLAFKNSDMNDVLKSLLVSDGSGHLVTAIRYDSNQTLEQRLAGFPFQIGDNEYLSTFFDHQKGARLEVKTGDRAVTGAILGARLFLAGPETDRRAAGEQLTLLTEAGDFLNFDLHQVTSLRFLDGRLEQMLQQYLQTIAQTTTRDHRSLFIDSAGHGDRQLRVSYILPTAIWKSSYRLTLAEPASLLEGWAVVDNTTGEDWNNVELSVVSGRPISFISPLDTPRYGQRQVAELPEDRAAGPVVYGGTIDGNVTVSKAEIALANSPVPAPASLNEFSRLEPFAALQPSSVATGSALGELFEYNFAHPVTIKQNESALLPFLEGQVTARKLLIFSERDGEHPVNAAELTNSTAKTLDGGPLTVYDGGAYAGEALVETVKAGDKRLIGYAVDYGTRVTTAYGSSDRHVREVHMQDGNLEIRSAQQGTKTYTVRNVDAKTKTLLIEQSSREAARILSPRLSERTANAYRFEVKLPASATETLQVVEERDVFEATAVSSATPDFLLTLVENKEINDRARTELRQLAGLKANLADLNRHLAANQSQTADLTADQTRLRGNIDSLNHVPGQEEQVRKYSDQLSANEAQFATLREQSRQLTAEKARFESDIESAVRKLDF